MRFVPWPMNTAPARKSKTPSSAMTPRTTITLRLRDLIATGFGTALAELPAKDETLFRAVNERIEAVSQGVSAGYEAMEFLCECERPDCGEHVNATPVRIRGCTRRANPLHRPSRPPRPPGRARRRG